MVMVVGEVAATRVASISAEAELATKTIRVEAAEMADLHSTATDPSCLTIPTAIQTTWAAKTPTWVAPKMGHMTKVQMALTKENLLSLCVNTWTMTILLNSTGKVRDWTLVSSQLLSRPKCSSRPSNSSSSRCFTISRVEAILAE